MDDEAKERFAKEVGDAYFAGDSRRLRDLCSDYEATVDMAEGTVRVTARPRHLAEPIEITVVKSR
ncbi:MAG TPA: hypothetical protein VI039_12770 [Solirubrobacterales bacterium]